MYYARSRCTIGSVGVQQQQQQHTADDMFTAEGLCTVSGDTAQDTVCLLRKRKADTELR